jgi:hypothetical protein
MYTITATLTNDKKNKKNVYAFSVNNEAFEAHYCYGVFANRKGALLELFHNGALLGTVEQPKTKHSFTVDSEAGPVGITAWVDGGQSFSAFLSNRGSRAGIEVDGKPVKHTLTDPGTHIQAGRAALFFLLFIFALKTGVTYLDAGFAAVIYFIPFLLTLLAAILYTRLTLFALISGLVLAILEMADFSVGLYDSLLYGGRNSGLAWWLVMRVCVLCLLINALRWRAKQKK